MFSGCVGEAVVELLVDVSFDGGDLFLLSGLEAEGCSERFELESGFIHLLGGGWIGVERVGARSSGVELKSESVSGDWVVAINVGMIDCHARHGAAGVALNRRAHPKSTKLER